MVSGVRSSSGFTLLELMITIVVMALLLLAAMPFTSAWVDGTRQMRARSNLIEAVGQARALAMRNPEATGTGAPVTAVLYQSGQRALCVVTLESGTWSATTCLTDGKSCQGAEAGKAAEGVSWLGCITSGGADLALRAGGADFHCVAYDSRGLQRDVTGLAGSACVSPDQSAVSITVGSQESVNVSLL